MVRDAVRGYLTLATGLTDVTRQRALDVARQLVSQGEATAGQTKAIAEELLAQGRTNRDTVVQLVRYEIERAVGRLGLAASDEVEALSARVRALESRLRELGEDRGASTAPTPVASVAPVAPAREAATRPVTKAATKKSAVKKAPAKSSAPRAASKRAGSKPASKAAGAKTAAGARKPASKKST